MRKPDFCLCENKRADQLRSNCEADQRLCFRFSDSTISLPPKFQISSHLLSLYSSLFVRPGRKPRRPVFSRRGSFSIYIGPFPYERYIMINENCCWCQGYLINIQFCFIRKRVAVCTTNSTDPKQYPPLHIKRK